MREQCRNMCSAQSWSLSSNIWFPTKPSMSPLSPISPQIPCLLSHLNTISLNNYKIDPNLPTNQSSLLPPHTFNILKSVLSPRLGTAPNMISLIPGSPNIRFLRCYELWLIADHQRKLVFAYFVEGCLCERAFHFSFCSRGNRGVYFVIMSQIPYKYPLCTHTQSPRIPAQTHI